jgi:hypothetical protein
VYPGALSVSSNLTVTANLSSAGGSAAQSLYDDGTHGDLVAGDNRYSFQFDVSGASPGSKSFPFAVRDGQGRSSNGAIALGIYPCPVTGPDVYVSAIADVYYAANIGGPTASGIYGYGIGTTACNSGDAPVLWYDYENTTLGYHANQHPVIAQNMFRLMNGRFEQIGQSWLKHGFTSTNGDDCAFCQDPPPGVGGDMLGVGCSDTYTGSLNVNQQFLGPRSEVNGTTGAYPYPHGTGTPGPVSMMLQVHYPDLDPAQNAGARYFVDGHYVTADDASFVNAGVNPQIHGNGLNNASWCEIGVPNPTGVGLLSSTHVKQAAIFAWQSVDPSVTLANADYTDSNIAARFIVGSKVTSNGNGTWTYEYAVYNFNADRAAGAFIVPLPPGAVVTNTGFHDVDSHSGEPFDLTDWTPAINSSSITWATTPYAANVNANALRWGTMYNFRFTANVAPDANGSITLVLFKPPNAGSPDTAVYATVPAPMLPACESADFNGDGDIGTDADIEAFFACLAGSCCATCGSADFNHDGDIGTDADIEAFFRVLAGLPC